MKRSKRIVVLLGVLACACIVTLITMKYEQRQEDIKNTAAVILEIPKETVTALSWEYDTQSFAFTKDENWQYDEDAAFPVSEDKINSLLEEFESFGASFVIENVEDYGQYGLDEPTCTIKIQTEDNSYEVLLGNYSTMDSERYVSIGDGNVYLVKEDPMEQFEVSISDLIQNDSAPSWSQVTSVEFSGNENYDITYTENSADTYCAEDVYFTEKDGSNKPLSTSRMQTYLNTLRYMGLTDYVTYNATEEELAEYGLDIPKLTVTVGYSYEDEDGQTQTGSFVLNVGGSVSDEASGSTAAENTTDASADGTASDETATDGYVRVGDSQIVYRVSANTYEQLLAVSYDDLRHEEIFSGSFDSITKLDVLLDDQLYTLTTEEKDGELVWYYNGEELDMTDVNSALTALSADSFTSENATEKQELALTLYLDNENYPEVSVQLYRYDGNDCLAVVDGETISLVARSQVVDLIEALNKIVLN